MLSVRHGSLCRATREVVGCLKDRLSEECSGVLRSLKCEVTKFEARLNSALRRLSPSGNLAMHASIMCLYSYTLEKTMSDLVVVGLEDEERARTRSVM